MGGVPHTCLDFQLFDEVNKQHSTCLLGLCVAESDIGRRMVLG